ncbi:MBOAT family protein [Desulfovibrio sp. ZJ200]|uniref:MBOAT family O-acyltransferase n=1 Tax=Desulfovibrio sp. ZJ200 TaxID=2709792 RepID=UPI0013EC7774|nr:MBOAT family protein [Desulfovibrio sp. ZJ200]
MLFNSYPFLFCFLPLLLLAWRLAGGSWRPALILLIFSTVFYGSWSAGFLLLLAALIAMNYAFGLALAAPDDAFAVPPQAGGQIPGRPGSRRRISRKGLLVLALGLNLLPLIWFKYSSALLFGAHWKFMPPELPPGISFYTFIQIAWLVDVYRRRFVPAGLSRHALFSACFPYVLSGPIVRYEQVGPQFDALAGLTAENLARGFSLFSLGLAKKVLLADGIAPYADAVFNAAENAFPLSGAEAWLGSFCYTFQLYFDFSGYTDMALGLGLMLGLRLPENFNSPYKSTGIVDFWRRWHITLSAWLRDFLYIPLGGNRAGRLMQYRNLFLTMLIGGAWHGAGWTFLIWGALHGLMLCVNHFFRARIKGSPAESILAAAPLRLLSIAFTFLCINFCWVVFRALSPDGALRVYAAMFTGPFNAAEASTQGLSGMAAFLAALLPNKYFPGWQPFALLAICAVLVWAFPNSREILRGRPDGSLPWLAWRATGLWATGLAALAFLSLILLSRQSSFLYFQF